MHRYIILEYAELLLLHGGATSPACCPYPLACCQVILVSAPLTLLVVTPCLASRSASAVPAIDVLAGAVWSKVKLKEILMIGAAAVSEKACQMGMVSLKMMHMAESEGSGHYWADERYGRM